MINAFFLRCDDNCDDLKQLMGGSFTNILWYCNDKFINFFSIQMTIENNLKKTSLAMTHDYSNLRMAIIFHLLISI